MNTKENYLYIQEINENKYIVRNNIDQQIVSLEKTFASAVETIAFIESMQNKQRAKDFCRAISKCQMAIDRLQEIFK